ncbi:MAG: TetR/AcrR family transcriptional regulator [Bacteroidales bacterium]|jgi:AcrR family transcriptional regulator|nr:TetR/AcrR family transcriptional regulator [Bacteroidales bacterium]
MLEKDKLTEEKIFESATLVFLEKGMDGARMRDIAERAGINKSLLHYYYRSKDRLFDAVFDKLAGIIFSRFAPIFDAGLTLDDKIRFFFREHISFLQKNPALPSFILNELNRNPARIRKLIQKIDIESLWTTLEEQHRNEFEKYKLTRDMMPQLMTSIAAMSIFPFAARTLVAAILEKLGYGFDGYLEERKEFAAEFVINSLKKGGE